MRMTVEGCSLPWELRGDWVLAETLAQTPWLSRGAVLGVKAATGLEERVRDVVCSMVYGADAGASDCAFIDMSTDRGDLREGFFSFLGRKLASDRELAEELGAMAAVRPMVFWHLAARASDFDSAEVVVDYCRKSGFRRSPLVLIGASGPVSPNPGAFDLSAGEPRGYESLLLDASEGEAWGAYVHLRVAWECAGFLEDLDRYSQAFETRLKLGDETGLALRMNEFARRSYEEGAETVGRRWALRYLLTQKCSPGEAARCKQRLSCGYLGELLWGLVHRLEAAFRAEIDYTVPPSSDAEELRRKFGAKNNFARSLYPDGCVEHPRSAWDFAAMGDIAFHFKERPDNRNYFEAMELRNAIAHGHPPAWNAILRARRLAAAFPDARGGHP